MLPVGAGPLTDRAVALLASSVGQTKTITLVRNGQAEPVRTRALTVKDLLDEQNIERTPEDALDVDPSAPLSDGETISYRAAIPVVLTVDGKSQVVRTAADTVGEVLAQERVVFDCHDRVTPAAPDSITEGDAIRVDHVTSWVERVPKAIPAPTEHLIAFNLGVGRVKVVRKGAPGELEVSYLVTRDSNRSRSPHRAVIGKHIVRKARAQLIATGIGDYSALASFAKREYEGTIRLAHAALSMVATAYTANCYGCSGMTASGQHAGHGIVAVDPSVIPLGSHLYIPGYGHATAGDTGGAIHGNRIDLGFNSDSDALQFGRRSVIVYVLHP